MNEGDRLTICKKEPQRKPEEQRNNKKITTFERFGLIAPNPFAITDRRIKTQAECHT